MGPAVVSWNDQKAAPGHPKIVCPDERRLDPGLKRLTDCAAPPEIPTYLVLGFPICFTVALGILLIGFRGALTPEAMGFLALGGLGILIVRYLNRHS